jgi:autotransporter-associated beta strand protein
MELPVRDGDVGRLFLNVTKTLVWELAEGAHGTFMVGEGDIFTLNHVLANNDGGNAPPWDGKSLTKTGAGTLILKRANAYTGDTKVEAGTLALEGAGSIAASSGLTLTGTDGAVTVFDISAISDSTTLKGLSGNQYSEIVLGEKSLVIAGSGTFAGVIGGAGSLTKTGEGELTLSGTVNQTNITLDNGKLYLEGKASASGTFTAKDGTTLGLMLDNTPALAANKAVIGNNAQLDVLGFNAKTASARTIIIHTDNVIEGMFIPLEDTQAPGEEGSYLKVGLQKINGDHDLEVTGVLVWRQEQDAHGTFNVGEGEKFTLGEETVLSDNTSGAKGEWWEGVTLTKSGQGTLVLNAANTYTGGTFVEAGTIEVGNDSALGGGRVEMATATLKFVGDHTLANEFKLEGDARFETTASDAKLAGDISGGGSLTKVGEGALILAGANSYEGRTTIEGGRLEIAGTLGTHCANSDSNGALCHGGVFANSATLEFNQRADLATGFEQILTGAVTGNGTLVKEGSGKLILNNDSTNAAGTVEVREGSFIVGRKSENGATTLSAGAVKVGDGGLLGGHGTIAGAVTVDGVLSPGNSYGHLTIAGGVFFKGGSVFNVEVNPVDLDKGDRLIVDNAFLEGGIVRHVFVDDGTDSYVSEGTFGVILDADQLVGEFDGVESTLAFLRPELEYDYAEGDVSLRFHRTAFGHYARTRNENTVATALESLGGDSALYRRIVGSATREEALGLLNELSGEIHGTLKGQLFARDDMFARRLSRHASFESAQRGAGDDFWVSVSRSYDAAEGDGNAGRATFHATEIAGGHDARLGDGGFAGLAFRFDAGRLEVNSRRSEAEITSGTAALYGGKEFPLGPGALRVFFSGAATLHDVDSERRIRFGGRKLEARYGGRSFAGVFETAYRVSPTERFFVEPYASVAWHGLRLDGFTEKGSSTALRKGKDRWNRAVSTLGMRLSTPLGGDAEFDVDVAWRHLHGGVTPKSVFTVEGSDRFTIWGADVSKDVAILGLGIGLKLTDNAKLRLRYDGELGTQGKSHAGQIVLEVKW